MNDALKRLQAYQSNDTAMLLIEQVGKEIERVEQEVARLLAEKDSEARPQRRRKYCPHCKSQLSTKAPVNCPDCGKPLVAAPPASDLEQVIRRMAAVVVPEPAEPEVILGLDDQIRIEPNAGMVEEQRAEIARLSRYNEALRLAIDDLARNSVALVEAQRAEILTLTAELERLRTFRDAVLGSITENAGLVENPYAYIRQPAWNEIREAVETETCPGHSDPTNSRTDQADPAQPDVLKPFGRLVDFTSTV